MGALCGAAWGGSGRGAEHFRGSPPDATLPMQEHFILKAMIIALTSEIRSILPPSVRRKAGFRAGDQVEIKASGGIVHIIPKSQVVGTYKSTKAESAAIRKGEAAIARGDSVSLTEFLNVHSQSRKTSAKSSRKVSRERSGEDQGGGTAIVRGFQVDGYIYARTVQIPEQELSIELRDAGGRPLWRGMGRKR